MVRGRRPRRRVPSTGRLEFDCTTATGGNGLAEGQLQAFVVSARASGYSDVIRDVINHVNGGRCAVPCKDYMSLSEFRLPTVA